MTVVGTRPEIIRLSRVIDKLDQHCEHTLVHTGQNHDYELSEVFFSDLGIRRPDHFLHAAGATGAETIGKVIIAMDALLARSSPDAMLVLGDTNSGLCVLPAKRRKIAVFHMEAGNRCFDDRVPEEINRRIIDHTADINLTYSAIAREYLLREGLPPDRVIRIGSPLDEVLAHYRPRIDASDVLDRLGLQPRGYFLVSAHREENVDSSTNLTRLVEVLNALAQRYDLPVIVSTHPRTRKRFDAEGVTLDARVQCLKPLAFTEYVKLQTRARAVLSDSGTISEESSILDIPALNLRETHERPEAMEEAAVMMVGLEVERVLQGLSILDSRPPDHARRTRKVADYEAPDVSEKIVRLIHSYTDYVNRTVWKKY